MHTTGEKTHVSIILRAANEWYIGLSDAYKIIEEFVKRGADLNGYCDHRTHRGTTTRMTPLMTAMTCNRQLRVEAFIGVGYIECGHRAFAKMLLEHGADPLYGASRAEGVVGTSLGAAILDSNDVGFQDVMEAGVDLTNEFWDGKGSMTPLMLTSRVPHKNSADMVAMILEQGVDPNLLPTAESWDWDINGSGRRGDFSALIHHLRCLGYYARNSCRDWAGRPFFRVRHVPPDRAEAPGLWC
jgi:hypothetical protein